MSTPTYITSPIPSKVQAALEHVRQFHPEVTMVLYAYDGKWRFMSDDMNVPDAFSPEIDTGILEDASESLLEFPAVFRLNVPYNGQ